MIFHFWWSKAHEHFASSFHLGVSIVMRIPQAAGWFIWKLPAGSRWWFGGTPMTNRKPPTNMGVCQNLLLSMLVGWTPINPSYFDVHKRATFGFDPVRHIRGFGWSGGNTPGWFDQHLKDVVNKSNSILVSAVGTCPLMGWQKRENRNRKPSIFPWVIWDFPVSFFP